MTLRPSAGVPGRAWPAPFRCPFGRTVAACAMCRSDRAVAAYCREGRTACKVPILRRKCAPSVAAPTRSTAPRTATRNGLTLDSPWRRRMHNKSQLVIFLELPRLPCALVRGRPAAVRCDGQHWPTVSSFVATLPGGPPATGRFIVRSARVAALCRGVARICEAVNPTGCYPFGGSAAAGSGTRSVCGRVGSSSGARGCWLKSKSARRSPSCLTFSRTVGRESGRPSVDGSRR